MKNVFGIDISDPFGQRVFNGDCFRTKRLSDELSGKVHDATELAKTEADEPPANPVMLAFCFGTGLVGAAGLLGAMNALEHEHIGNPLVLFLVAVVMFVACGVIYRFMRKDINSRKSSDTANEYRDMRDRALFLAHSELGIPAGAPRVDILTQMYLVEKNGKIKPSSASGTTHINAAHYIYTYNSNLCIATNYTVFEIPLSSLRSARLEKKKATFPYWTKTERWGSKTYKKYKIGFSEGKYYAKYYSVQIEDEKGEFELLIPNYDFETFSSVTGIRADV